MKISHRKYISAPLKGALAALFLLAAFCLFLFMPSGKKGAGMSSVTAKAASSPAISIGKYTVEMDIAENRDIAVREEITVTFLKSGLTMFYRSLPVDQGDRYRDIKAECPENAYFSWYVADNPDMSEFIDVNCVGAADRGMTWTYRISYTMTSSGNEVKNGMLLDVVGAGWPVELKDVDVMMTFPGKTVSYEIFSGGFGNAGNPYAPGTLSEDGKTLKIHADSLPLVYNDTYRETMASAVTVRFSLEKGALKGYTASRIFTGRLAAILGVSAAGLGISVILFFLFHKKREIIPVVGLKAPQDMDPLRMGKLIDGTVDSEDITSMIYWFASQGYLFINFEDEKDPVLVRRVVKLPDEAPSYQKVLFDGLFRGEDSAKISSLTNKFYVAADNAKSLLAAKDIRHFEGKSSVGFIGACAVAILLFFCVPFFVSLQVGGGYKYFAGFFMAIPVLFAALFLRVRINFQFKSKKRTRVGWIVAVLLLASLISCFYIFVTAKPVLDVYEKLIIAVFAWACVFVGAATVCRTEEYTRLLGEILGFKEFITVTEEDKIKFMLQENPELFYDILPYAQVLGVTKEWEDKFKNILLEPPSWYVGSHMTVFDYMLINACMRRAAINMMSRPQSSGSGVGHSGGGGSFGGFSGGGHGGGGGGAR